MLVYQRVPLNFDGLTPHVPPLKPFFSKKWASPVWHRSDASPDARSDGIRTCRFPPHFQSLVPRPGNTRPQNDDIPSTNRIFTDCTIWQYLS